MSHPVARIVLAAHMARILRQLKTTQGLPPDMGMPVDANDIVESKTR